MTAHVSLPWSEPVEQSLLGAVLIKPEILGWLEVDPGCFHGTKHQAIWAAMLKLHERGRAIDTVTLEAEFTRTGTLDAIGGLAYLSRIAIDVPSVGNAESYAATLEEYRVTREVMRAGAEVSTRNLAGEELLDALLVELATIKRAQANEKTAVADTMPEMVRRMIDDVDAQAKGLVGSSFVPTGIAALDRQIGGGVPLGTVTAIGGRPGEGKSSTLLAMAKHAAKLGKVAVIFTIEDPRDRWQERMLADRTLIPVDRIYSRKLSATELGALARAADELKSLRNLHIVHAHGMGAQDIIRVATVMGAQLVGVDYAQKVKSPERGLQLHESIEASSKMFGDYAGKTGAGVVILSQLGKDVEKEQRRPNKSDLRYGDGLVQEAKLIILLNDPKDTHEPMLREMLIAKRNQGEKELIAKVLFDGAHCRFMPRAQEMLGGISDDF